MNRDTPEDACCEDADDNHAPFGSALLPARCSEPLVVGCRP